MAPRGRSAADPCEPTERSSLDGAAIAPDSALSTAPPWPPDGAAIAPAVASSPLSCFSQNRAQFGKASTFASRRTKTKQYFILFPSVSVSEIYPESTSHFPSRRFQAERDAGRHRGRRVLEPRRRAPVAERKRRRAASGTSRHSGRHAHPPSRWTAAAAATKLGEKSARRVLAAAHCDAAAAGISQEHGWRSARARVDGVDVLVGGLCAGDGGAARLVVMGRLLGLPR